MLRKQLQLSLCLLVFPLLSSFFVSLIEAHAQTEIVASAPNADPTYVALKKIAIGNEAVQLENVVLKREFATFTFRTGTLFFVTPVNGKVTGAVFVGEGTLALKPRFVTEQRSLSILSRSPEFLEHFETLVLRFTDGTYDELQKAGSAAQNTSSAPRATRVLSEVMDTLAHNRYTRYNLSARILQDVLGTAPGGLFTAFVQGKDYDEKEAFILDPQGVTMYGLGPEEVAFVTYNENKFGYWAVNHLAAEYSNGTAKGNQMNSPLDLQSQRLDIEIGKNAEMKATAVTTFTAVRNEVKVAPFQIFRNFKIQSVTDEADQPLSYIFEPRDWLDVDRDDADNLSIILPKPLAAGEKFTFKISYGGKEAVKNTGGGNYYPIAREDWYPFTGLGDYADYEMTFHIPKNMKMAATGTLIDEKTEGDWNVTRWRTEAPVSLAGFNFGKFKGTSQTLKNGFVIQSYANEEQPDWVKGAQLELARDDGNFRLGVPGAQTRATNYAVGTMDTTTMMKKPLAEAELSMQIYGEFFGPIAYKRLSMTQQTACTYGQSFAGIVWLPICSFYDTTVRHQLGVDDTREPYWNFVAPHEVSHQWWGMTVGWESYRDQWISEGFAELSSSIFVQGVYSKDRALYDRFWRMHQQYLQEKNRFGFRPIDAGPVTMGFRVDSSRAGSNYQQLIYGKGGFILHMIRMMLWSPETGDQKFKEVMRDFVKTYYNKPASTEDFKAVLEKHITPDLNLDGNGKLDWFFNEWVYGTELPKYDFSFTLDRDANGDVVHFRLTQSGVSPEFKMLVPIYLELSDGRVFRLGSAAVAGNKTVEKNIPVGKVNVKRLMLNYNYDVLSTM